MRLTILAAAIFYVARCFGQSAAAPAFEAASVKVSHAAPGGSDFDSTIGSIRIRNFTLRRCIQIAYHVKESQVLGGPKWLDSDRYDIDAKAAGAAQGPELMAMLQTLLAARFQVVFHKETKTFPGYALVVVKTGLKMQAASPGEPDLSTHNGHMTAQKASMADLAKNLARRWGVEVEDKTGIAGVFDFQLELPPQEKRTAPAAGDAAGTEAPDPAAYAVALTHALEDQLGLKLEGHKALLEVLAIDHAEKPAEN